MIDRDSDWAFRNGQWLHRPWWKVAVNTVLRLFQPQPYKYVIYTNCIDRENERPIAIGYGFGRILHQR